MAWVKLHTEILSDPKLMRAARAGCRGLDLLPWLLAFAKLANDDGRLSINGTAATPKEIAHFIPEATAQRVEACIRSLLALNILSPDYDQVPRFAAWHSRQGQASQSKEAVAERVRRHRARRAGKDDHSTTVTRHVTHHVTHRNPVTVTAGNRVAVTQEERRGEEKRGEYTPLPPKKPAYQPPLDAPATTALTGLLEPPPDPTPEEVAEHEARRATLRRQLLGEAAP